MLVFVIHGFTRENVRLQPWRYVFEIARFAARQQPVVIVTNGERPGPIQHWDEGLQVVATDLLAVSRRAELIRFINAFVPHGVWWMASPRSIAYRDVLQRLHCPVTALVTCPLYGWKLLGRSLAARVPMDELKTLLLQRLIPRRLFAGWLNQPRIGRVVVLSQSNRKLLQEAGVDAAKLHVVPAGIDGEDRLPADPAMVEAMRQRLGFPDDGVVFLYLGAARRIRGLEALLEAFAAAVGQAGRPIYLGVMARGADAGRVAALQGRAQQLGVADRTRFIGGWLSREEVWGAIEAADVVTLPFLLVPSDVPIAVLEALARGKPVLGSPVDGIPELVRGRGVVADPFDRQALAAAVIEMADGNERPAMSREAARFMESYPDWEGVGAIAFAPGLRAAEAGA